MSETGLPDYLDKIHAEIEKILISILDDSEKELALKALQKCKITPADLQREYSPVEVRELCLRTKVRVNMSDLNCLFDAKKRLGRRLENRSESYINRMLIKSVVRKMVEPYTDEEVACINLIRRSWLKKVNNIRLDQWKTEREFSYLMDLLTQLDSSGDALELVSERPELLPVPEYTEEFEDMIIDMETEQDLWGIPDEYDTGVVPPES
ncbi:telomere-binding protein cav-like [Drosophila madeirensis]|uniref:Telomere-binding protein cav-like n=1 Tax=Drosophila madeirensis TaxID=30013 RepID=A0AAU9EUX4_DROMD